MAEDGKTYQPGWGEKKHHHHHHHVHPSEKNRGFGGALRMKDKQAYYGLMAILIALVLVGIFFLVRLIVKEVRAMPMDDPNTEMKVDELRIHKVEEQEALQAADSLAQAYQLDSVRHVQVETTPVYRPPKREDTWYITQREWKDLWKKWKIWKKGKEE